MYFANKWFAVPALIIASIIAGAPQESRADGSAIVGCKQRDVAVLGHLKASKVAGKEIDLGKAIKYSVVVPGLLKNVANLCQRQLGGSAEDFLIVAGLRDKVESAKASAEANAILECESNRLVAKVQYLAANRPDGLMMYLRNGEPERGAIFAEDDEHKCPDGIPYQAGDSPILEEYNPEGASGIKFAACRDVRDGEAHSKVFACKQSGSFTFDALDGKIELIPPNKDHGNFVCEFSGITKIRALTSARGAACYYATSSAPVS